MGNQGLKRIDKKNGFKILAEQGVTMLFNLLPNGYVTITLYPAKTELMRPLEDSILLYRYIKATWLLKEKNQKSLWRDFMVYTECTSLIGTPSIWQRLRIFWLKSSRQLCVDGVYQPIKVWKGIQKIVNFVQTVGLSGFLLSVVQQFHKEEIKDYSLLLKQSIYCVEGIQKGQGELLKEIQYVNANIDSLMKLTPLSQKKAVLSNTRN